MLWLGCLFVGVAWLVWFGSVVIAHYFVVVWLFRMLLDLVV